MALELSTGMGGLIIYGTLLLPGPPLIDCSVMFSHGQGSPHNCVAGALHWFGQSSEAKGLAKTNP